MTFVFTLKGLPGEADMVIPTLCNGPDHARLRAQNLLSRHPKRCAIEVTHHGKPLFRLESRPAVEL